MKTRNFALTSIAFLSLVMMILILSACDVNINANTNIPENQDTGTTAHKSQFACNKPYIQVGSECCLDKNDNKICDRDEGNNKDNSDKNNNNNAGTGQNTNMEQSQTAETENNHAESNSQNSNSQNSNSNTNSNVLECNIPYIKYNNSCCLDLDNNNICDVLETNDDKTRCGNSICEQDEDSSTCCTDCGCDSDELCVDNECQPKDNFKNYTNISAIFKPIVIPNKTFFPILPSGSNSSTGSINFNFVSNFTLVNSALEKINKSSSLNDYVVVYVDYLKSLYGAMDNGEKKDPYGEFFTAFLVQDLNDNRNYVIKWPIGGYKKISRYTQIFKNDYSHYTIPLYAKSYSYINNTLHIDGLMADTDTASPLPFIDYTVNSEILFTISSGHFIKSIYGDDAKLNSGDRIRNMLGYYIIYSDKMDAKTDLLGYMHYSTKKVKYLEQGFSANLRNREGKENYVIGLKAKKVRLPSSMHVKVILKKISIYRDGDEGSNKGDLTLWYRVADEIQQGEFGSEFTYKNNQNFGTMKFTAGENSAIYPNKVLYETTYMGPFLYIELDLFDRDSKCIDVDKDKFSNLNENFDCYLSTKFQDVGIFTYLMFGDDERLLQNPDKTITIPITYRYDSDNGKGSAMFELEIIRYPLISN